MTETAGFTVGRGEYKGLIDILAQEVAITNTHVATKTGNGSNINTKGISTSHVASVSSSDSSNISTILREYFHSPHSSKYFDYLVNSSIQNLKNEPVTIEAEQKMITRQLSNLAFSEYKTFLRAHDASKSIQSQFSSLENRVECLLEKYPPLSNHLQEFEEIAPSLLQERKDLLQILSQDSKLLELFEVPHVYMTFVRNGYFEEAMDLQVHMQRLSSRYPNIPMIQDMSSEIQGYTGYMLSQLVQMLRGEIKLPLCIRIMGYLRRMEAFPEHELRLIFLQQRNFHLSACLSKISASDTFEYLKKYIEVSRENLFEIISQYKNIFSDSTPPAYVPSAGSSLLVFDTAPGYSTQSILASYVNHQLTSLMKVLKEKMEKGVNDVSVVNSLLTQTLYFGMSLGRVGIDFRQTVAGIFESNVERIFRAHVTEGLESFAQVVRCSSDPSAEKNLRGPTLFPLASTLVTSTRRSFSERSSSVASLFQPPTILLSFPALAVVLNSFLTAFNQLRILPCLSLISPLQSFLVSSLELKVSEISRLSNYWESWSDSRREQYQDICRVLSDVLVPFIVKSFEQGIFSSYVSSPITEKQLQKLVNPILIFSEASRSRLNMAESNRFSKPAELTQELEHSKASTSVDFRSVESIQLGSLEVSSDSIVVEDETLDLSGQLN